MSTKELSARDRANKRYDEKTAFHMHLKLNKKTDADIIEKLKTVSSMQGYIKSLIRADIAQR